MKGRSNRRRQKNAQAAKSANLYKAQFGKASKWDALPEPPQARDMTRLTRVEREMKAMLDLMASDPHPHHSADCDTKERLHEELAGTNNTAPERRAQSTNHADDGVCKTATHASKTKVKRKLKLEERKKRRKTIRANQVGCSESKALVRLMAEPNIKRKQAASPFCPETILFGEVAVQPPQVNLKRRHWRQHGADPCDRHAEVLRKNLEIGNSRLKLATEDTPVHVCPAVIAQGTVFAMTYRVCMHTTGSVWSLEHTELRKPSQDQRAAQQ